jgi:hypothetical protein
MGKLLGMCAAGFTYLCIGTVLTLCLLLGYAFSKGYLEKEKVTKIIAVVQGNDLSTIGGGANLADSIKLSETHEQPSLEDIEKRRAVQVRNLELREEALQTGLERMRFEQRKLTDEKNNYDQITSAFEKQLEELHTGTLATGRENIRLIWESIKPKQAKEQMLQMIQAREQVDVVAILSAMPVGKRAKIIGEFKTPEESKTLEEILDLIRRGVPEVKVVSNAEKQLEEAKSNAAPIK